MIKTEHYCGAKEIAWLLDLHPDYIRRVARKLISFNLVLKEKCNFRLTELGELFSKKFST